MTSEDGDSSTCSIIAKELRTCFDWIQKSLALPVYFGDILPVD